MKLQVITNNQKPIEGYKTAVVGDKFDVSDVVANSCEFIMSPDACDAFHLQDFEQFISTLVGKLRLGGSIVLGGTDIRAFCKSVSLGIIPLQDASAMVANVRSMTSPDVVIQLLNKFGLKVETVNIDGLHYEVKAGRS